MAHIANKVDAKDKKLFEVFSGQRYKIDIFQREYRWQRTHIESLISDLTTSFLKSYNEGDSIESCNSYDCYYMGPIVLCEGDKGDLSIVDGQQRLTSLTLLLIYIDHQQKALGIDEDVSADIDQYIYVKKGGKKTLVLDIESRNTIIKNLIDNPSTLLYENNCNQSESNQNIINRYEDICTLFPNEIRTKDVLPVFAEWLMHKIVLVEVRAYNTENAYTIFETMNNRGLTLNPTEILKGYLLSKIVENHDEFETKAEEANTFWINRIHLIKNTTEYSESDLDFFRAWLRAKYAETQRAKKIDSENEDFELIGTQFHSWVKNNSKKIGLQKPDDYYYFIRSDFDFYSSIYLQIHHFKYHYEVNQEYLYINAPYTIADSLSFPLLLSPVSKIDNEEEIEKKIKTVSRYIDCFTNIRMLQNRTITQSSIRNNLYELVKKIRNNDTDSLFATLQADYNGLISSSDIYSSLQYMNNSGYYHYFYARIMYYLDSTNDFKSYLRSRKHDSYVLARVFSMEDFGNQFDEPTLYAYFNSVANYTLLRRSELGDYPEGGGVSEIISFLRNRQPLLTPEIETDSAMEFILTQEERLKILSKKIWAFNR